MENKNKISAVIITKNEEKNIERCLKSLTWVDEIVVVDSGSTDKTVEICKQYECKIIKTEWFGYGKNKQLAVNSASNNWVLSIDADEEVAQESVPLIKNVVSANPSIGYKVQIKSYYLGKLIRYSGWGNEFKLRIFNKQYGNYDDAEVHETVILKGEKIKSKIVFYHHTYPTVEKQLEKINRYSTLQAKQLYDKRKKYSLPLIAFFTLNKFFATYFFRLGFLDGKEGFILAYFSSVGVFSKYVKLWKLNKK